ncbi:hypothetical protein A4A49_09010 [Nicotiana attenuata]|uniref:Uncharacterized protein n=1 Tax=Nicotiana attenuata TaxID=49451 RepID=A0A1J6I2Y0_NICAT|nr:hypothetical protein A4A49_09010 [Nicotiana attenuata]
MQNQYDFICLQQDNRHVVEVHTPEEHGQATEMPVMTTPLEQSAEATHENLTNQPATNEREVEGMTQGFEQVKEFMDSTTRVVLAEETTVAPRALTEETTVPVADPVAENADHLVVPTLQRISRSEGIPTAEIRQSTRTKQTPIWMQDYVTKKQKSTVCLLHL